MRKRNNGNFGKQFFPCILIAALFAVSVVMSGCGGSTGGGESHATNAARVVGLVAVPAGNGALSRAPGEAAVEAADGDQARTAEREAAQAASPCGAPPAGYVVVPNATVSDSGGAAPTTTDANGCFSMTINNFGTHIFTVTKANAAGGTTTLMKAASIGENASVTLVDTNAISIQSTVAAIIVKQKIDAGEENVDPAAVEAYVETIKDQDDIKALETAVIASAAANPAVPFSQISSSTLTNSEATTDKPVIFDATVTGSPVAASGGSVNISGKAVVFNTTIKSVSASLATTGGTPITVSLLNTSGSIYSATYTFTANAGATETYSVTITAVDAKDVSNAFSTASLSITRAAGVVPPRCGDGAINGTDVCDNGVNNTDTACTAAYGSTCSYCDTFCQTHTVIGASCGDSTVQAGNGETCDEGNTVTEICAYGQTSCTVCNSSCQSVAGATSYCGDSTTDAGNGETCDEGANNGQPNHCNATCDGTVPNPCGNSVVDPGETCDDGNTTTETCTYGQTSCTVCDASCANAAGAASYCGDSTTDFTNGETCDDGDTSGGDGCSATCQNDSLDTNAWLTIPAGDLVMGCATADGSCNGNEYPKHTVTLSEYKIQKYEVTNAQYAACVAATTCTAPQYTYSSTRTPYYGNAVYDKYPVIYVDWNQASAYCVWIGGRLPTEAEWEKAARGPSPSENIYPWGDGDANCTLANMSGPGCTGDTDEVSSHPTGASYYGVMDMAGNVHEWVNDWYDSSYYLTGGPPWIDPQGPGTGSSRVLRGGRFGNLAYLVRTSYRYYYSPTTKYNWIGFRCAQD